MERIQAFLPSVLILACIAGATFLYLKWVIKRFGDNFKSVEWHEKNQMKVIWTVGVPLTGVLYPAVEELIFRAPLIITFSAVSSVAWYGIFASSGLFALVHWFGKKIGMLDILSVREKGDHKLDDVVVEANRLHQEAGKVILVRKILDVVISFLAGILLGYYGIKYQSIWVAFGIHSVWNLIMPTVLQLLTILLMSLGMLVLLGILFLWDKVRWHVWGRSW